MGRINDVRWKVAAFITGIPEYDLRCARQLYKYEAAMRSMGLAAERARTYLAEGTTPRRSSGVQGTPVGTGGQAGRCTDACYPGPTAAHTFTEGCMYHRDPFECETYLCCGALIGGCHRTWCCVGQAAKTQRLPTIWVHEDLTECVAGHGQDKLCAEGGGYVRLARPGEVVVLDMDHQ